MLSISYMIVRNIVPHAAFQQIIWPNKILTTRNSVELVFVVCGMWVGVYWIYSWNLLIVVAWVVSIEFIPILQITIRSPSSPIRHPRRRTILRQIISRKLDTAYTDSQEINEANNSYAPCNTRYNYCLYDKLGRHNHDDGQLCGTTATAY